VNRWISPALCVLRYPCLVKRSGAMLRSNPAGDSQVRTGEWPIQAPRESPARAAFLPPPLLVLLCLRNPDLRSTTHGTGPISEDRLARSKGTFSSRDPRLETPRNATGERWTGDTGAWRQPAIDGAVIYQWRLAALAGDDRRLDDP
jgi:hypothetical protein